MEWMNKLRGTNKTSKCKAGYVYKKGYTRKNTGRKVAAVCAKEEGKKMHCPEGYLPRTSYIRRISTSVRRDGFLKGNTRVFPRASTIRVKATCFREDHAKNLIKYVQKGELKKSGYSYKLSEGERKESLAKAVREYGARTIFKKLDAVAKLTKRSNPLASATLLTDRNWVRKEFM